VWPALLCQLIHGWWVENNRSVTSCDLPADARVMSGISWQITAGHTSVTVHSSPMDQVAEYTWSNFAYSPLIIRGSTGRAPALLCQLIHGWWVESNRSVTSCTLPADPRVISGESLQSTAGHTYVTLHSSPVDQLAEHSWSHFCYSPLITRRSALSSWSTDDEWRGTEVWPAVLCQLIHGWWVESNRSVTHFGYSPLITRVSAGRVLLVTLQLLSTHHPWISWQSTAGHTSCDQLYSASRSTGYELRVTEVWPAVLCQLIHGWW
jgi:hypothetical protein